ncbi:MAG: hypothetical protein K0S04_3590 [Herbinix sp.]|nr:hypothetical protein [Herbinix sp.]
MPKARDPNRDMAFQIYKDNNGNIDLVEIASQLNISPGSVRGWKSKDNWEQQLNGTLQSNTERSKRSKGGQPGNKNADGGPPGNKKAEKYGFFAKWLPEETREIMGAIQSADPLDLLWDNIQLQYTAIIRAQKLMYVKDQEDSTTTQIAQGYSESGSSEKWEVQQAWDKHATFLQAQSRAMKTLESMIKQYDELLHNNWELATEEQKARIALIKKKADLNNKSDTSLMEALLELVGGNK